MANWQEIKHAWITGSDDVTFAVLAKRYKVRRGTISSRAAREGWSDQRETHRNQVESAARKQTLQAQIQGIVEGTVQDYDILEQFVAKGLMDLTGNYPANVDPKKGIKVFPATLLTALRDRRRLREWVHGEEHIPDDVAECIIKVMGVDLSKFPKKE